MFSQATAMLVALPTLLAAELDPVALPSLLCEGLAVACPPDAGLLLPRGRPIIGFPPRGVVVDGVLGDFRLSVRL